MEGTTYERDETTPRTLQPHAALIPAATRLTRGPNMGWHFAVLVRAAYSRLEGSA
jgi:hypothetical protein